MSLARRYEHVTYVAGRLIGDFGRLSGIEFLAQHRPRDQKVDGRLRQQIDAARQKASRPVRRMQIGHRQGLDAPTVRLRDQRSRFDHAAKHRGRHERATFRQSDNGVNHFGRQRPGHRLHQKPDVLRLESGKL